MAAAARTIADVICASIAVRGAGRAARQIAMAASGGRRAGIRGAHIAVIAVLDRSGARAGSRLAGLAPPVQPAAVAGTALGPVGHVGVTTAAGGHAGIVGAALAVVAVLDHLAACAAARLASRPGPGQPVASAGAALGPVRPGLLHAADGRITGVIGALLAVVAVRCRARLAGVVNAAFQAVAGVTIIAIRIGLALTAAWLLGIHPAVAVVVQSVSANVRSSGPLHRTGVDRSQVVVAIGSAAGHRDVPVAIRVERGAQAGPARASIVHGAGVPIVAAQLIERVAAAGDGITQIVGAHVAVIAVHVLGALYRQARSVVTQVTGGALDPHAVPVDAGGLIADFVRPAGRAAAPGWPAIAPGAALVGRALDADTFSRDAGVFETDLRWISAVFGLTIQGPAPAIGATQPRLALDTCAGYGHALTQVTHLVLAEASHLLAVCRVAVPLGAQLIGRATDPHTALPDATAVHADLAVARTGLALAILRIAAPSRAQLPLRALHIDAGRRRAFLLEAHFTQTRAVSPATVPREAAPPGAALLWPARHLQASLLHAFRLAAEEPQRTGPARTFTGPANPLDQHPV